MHNFKKLKQVLGRSWIKRSMVKSPMVVSITTDIFENKGKNTRWMRKKVNKLKIEDGTIKINKN